MMAISFYQNEPFGGFSFPCGLFPIHFLFWWIFWFCRGITCNCPLACIIDIIIPAVGINIMAPIFWSNTVRYFITSLIKLWKYFLLIISLKCYESVSLLLEIVLVWGKINKEYVVSRGWVIISLLLQMLVLGTMFNNKDMHFLIRCRWLLAFLW